MSAKMRLLAGVGGLVLVAAIVAAVLTGIRYWSMNAEEDARASAAVAAGQYTKVMFERDAKTVATNVDRTMEFLVGSERESFQKNMTDYHVVDEVKKQKIVTKVTIQGTAVMENTRDSAKVLVFMNQSSSRGTTEEAQVDASRLVYDMTRQSGEWKISGIDILDDNSLRDRVEKVDAPPSTAVPIPGGGEKPAAPGSGQSQAPAPAPGG
ncbi:hypothetical protein [Gordonia zhaorongruii]|uniref:hypothetical protein n=1 Tax=Gordonia zhaorongruii TaxID=2597659 RepID=UPI00164307FB|nr:hypothetical protein [Gordonia zhaorongruii]